MSIREREREREGERERQHVVDSDKKKHMLYLCDHFIGCACAFSFHIPWTNYMCSMCTYIFVI